VGHAGPFHELLGIRIDNDVRFALLGGTLVGQNALIRFYVAHCVALPIIMGVLMAIHFWRIRKDGGISRPKRAESAVVPATNQALTESSASDQRAAWERSPAPRQRLLAYIQGDSFSGKRDQTEDEVQVWPHLVVREFMAGLTVIVLLWTISLVFNAPLEGQANPDATPNPAKAPWYFDGLQELLVYFDPWIAGVALPGIIVVGLAAIPYLDINREGGGEYAFGQRKFAVTVFSAGVFLWFALIFIGMFMRGPNWAWYWPWEDWTIPKQTLSVTWSLLWGSLLLMAYFALGMLLPALLLPKFVKALGPARYLVTMILLLLMIAVPAKIALRLLLDIKYVLATPWFNI